MAIEVHEITDKQLEQILSYKEGHFLDLKAKEIKPSDLTKTISAFANADGGELYIGIAESGTEGTPHRWEGFANPEGANAHLQVFEHLFPLGEDFAYNFLVHPANTGVVLQVTVRKTRGIVRPNDDIPRIRRGAQNLRVDTDEKLRILERNKGITSFEDEPVSVGLDRVSNSENVIRFILEVVPTSEPEEWLRKNELIQNQKPTVAGVVLFADLPQAILPKRTGIGGRGSLPPCGESSDRRGRAHVTLLAGAGPPVRGRTRAGRHRGADSDIPGHPLAAALRATN